jgi:hypothetical protein
MDVIHLAVGSRRINIMSQNHGQVGGQECVVYASVGGQPLICELLKYEILIVNAPERYPMRIPTYRKTETLLFRELFFEVWVARAQVRCP